MSRRASSIRTSILVDDKEDFEEYLRHRGIEEFSLFESKSSDFLNIYFDNPAEIMKYQLRGIEDEYKAARSSRYFYDLDHPWEAAEDIFGNDISGNDIDQ